MKELFNKLRDNWQILLFFLIPVVVLWICINEKNISALLGEKVCTFIDIILILATIIINAIMLGIFGVAIYKDIKKKERENYAEWVSESISILHSIEYEFQSNCQKIITEAFTGRNVMGGIVIDKYHEKLSALKDEYTHNLDEKISERCHKYRTISVPKYLEKEYERNISEIADTFRHFGDFMLEQIKYITK